MTTTTTSTDKTRLIVGGLLIAASVAIGAGSDAWSPERERDAPLLDAIDALPPVPANELAAERTQRTPRDPSPASSESDVADPSVVKDLVVAPAPLDTIVEEALLVLEGSASWYSDALAGHPTASGESYDPRALIAAHRAFPFGTRLRVTNLANERSVEVRVIDRGPFVAGRILDLSRSAAEEIGILRAGHGRVRVEVLEYGG